MKPVPVDLPVCRRPTGRVPRSARTPRSVGTWEKLLEAREATAGWPGAEPTGEAIRKAVRTSSANVRMLWDALRAELDADSEATAA
ncbi:hypothetical protein ACFRR7_31185 [Streptomyces sp. NPDC056909]|uniref:hypothetical protein n=1 Tax=Streptomyces sp. NPDC056909 TaxID=3345963 RepID=UPI0036C9336D